MVELLTVVPPAVALDRLLTHLPTAGRVEEIPGEEALDRVLSERLTAPGPLPTFARSAMDGYAVRAADTFGATESLPAYLNIIGEIPMGRAPDFGVSVGQAALIHTGGMLPPGADAVVMVERTQKIQAMAAAGRYDSIEVLRAVAVGENVIQIGEDIQPNEPLFQPGHILRPQDIGGLMALGITRIKVAGRPRVAIISSGDEVVSPYSQPGPGQVRDVNTATIAGLVRHAGGIPLPQGIISDNFEVIQQTARQAFEVADMLIFSAGSSVSTRDMTADVINTLGQPGVLVHGISVKPGKPTVLAVCDGKPVFGLPGNPVSAMVVTRLLVTPVLWRLQGATYPPQPRSVQARLTHNVASVTGREDYVPVSLANREGELWGEPVFGQSNLIYRLVKADGMVKIALDMGGVQAGEWAEVHLF